MGHTTIFTGFKKEFSLFETENPRSIVNLIPPVLAKHLRVHYEGQDRELFGLTENQLLEELSLRKKRPSPADQRIRLNFWTEYDRCLSSTKIIQIDMPSVIKTLISKEAFYKYYIVKADKMAFMLCPPISYQNYLEDTVTHSIEAMRKILEINPEDRKGHINIKLVQLQVSVFRELCFRLDGQIAPTFPAANGKVWKKVRTAREEAAQEHVDIKSEIKAPIPEKVKEEVKPQKPQEPELTPEQQRRKYLEDMRKSFE